MSHLSSMTQAAWGGGTLYSHALHYIEREGRKESRKEGRKEERKGRKEKKEKEGRKGRKER